MTISPEARPGYVYDRANDQWVPIATLPRNVVLSYIIKAV